MIAVCTVCMLSGYFIMLSPRLPVTHNTCLHFDFLLGRPNVGGIYYLLFVAMWSREVLSREQCVSHQLSCAPVAVCRSTSNGDEQL